MFAGCAMALANNNVNAATKIDDTHVQVVYGDTLSEIANEYGVDVDTLASNNHIANKNLIHVGDKLVVTPTKNDTNNTVAQPTVNTNNSTATANNTASQTTTNTASTTTAPATGDSSSAKEWIAQHESGGNYGSSSVHDQFIAAGGTEAMWNTIVMPESGGNPNATNGQYSGLGQTNQSWGTGSVAEQTQGMINYANSRYGSISNAIAFRASNGWW